MPNHNDPNRRDITRSERGKAIIHHLRRAHTTDSREVRSRALRVAATLLVAMRAHYTDPETGDPDWTGRSYEYRRAVQELYSAAGLPSSGQSSTKSAIRYHIGNALRERLDKESLDEAGLLPEAPRDRGYLSQKKRAGGNWEDAVRDTIAGVAALTTRLSILGVPNKRLPTSDYTRLTNSIRDLREWLRSALDALSEEDVENIAGPAATDPATSNLVRLLKEVRDTPAV